ncbi:DUF6274 family protein [Streptomyces sp. NPDC048436]|uniref:DUF6274 family protein n=1 Tax=Streptomyces sp. NPDC048436 TaxID=3365550 RepID=UPI0037102176
MTASAASARHETRALLRAHLSAATSYRHLTRHCPICHRLERLALETASGAQSGREGAPESAPESAPEAGEDESPPNA